jgi:hypothetical protein
MKAGELIPFPDSGRGQLVHAGQRICEGDHTVLQIEDGNEMAKAPTRTPTIAGAPA